MYQSGFPISFGKLNINKLPKMCFLYTLCRPNEKQPKFDVLLHVRYTIYSFIWETFDWSFQNLWAYLFIITYLNVTTSFHLTDSKNLYTSGILCHNCTWLLNTARVNLIENVLSDFSKNVVSTVPFSVTADVAPYS